MSNIDEYRRKLLKETLNHLNVVGLRWQAGDHSKWVYGSLKADVKLLSERVHDDSDREYIRENLNKTVPLAMTEWLWELRHQGKDLSTMLEHLPMLGIHVNAEIFTDQL